MRGLHLRSALLIFAFVAPAAALAADVSLPPALDPYVKILAIVPVIQGIASVLAIVPSFWGKGQQNGPGSGWFKFWHKVASLPAPTLKVGGAAAVQSTGRGPNN